MQCHCLYKHVEYEIKNVINVISNNDCIIEGKIHD